MDLILFDVDGTLVEPAQNITLHMHDILLKLSKKYVLGVICGGTFTKISNQIPTNLFKYIFTESGAILHINNKCIYERNMLDYCDSNKTKVLDELISKSLEFIIEQKSLTNSDNTNTDHIERRKGLVYVSFPGINATLEHRNNFLNNNDVVSYRTNLMQQLSLININNYFSFATGGNAGLTISLKDWNKARVMDMFGLNSDKNKLDNKEYFNKIYFFGDRTDVGGNDYPLYIHEKVQGIKVTNPEDTYVILCAKFLND